MHTIAYIFGAVNIFVLLLSFLRERAFAHYFGTSELLDIYVASFSIPDMLFMTATAFVSVYALLPMFEEKMREGQEEFQKFINTSFYFLVLFLLLGATALFFSIPFLADTFFESFTGDSRGTFILFSRVYLIQASFFAVSAFFTAILQLKRKFILYSILPILYNSGIILGVMVLYPLFGAVGLALGVVLGALLHVGIQIPILIHNKVLPYLAPTKRAIKECWRVIRMSVPRASALLSQGIAEVFIFSAVVSISKGALSAYYFAQSLRTLPLIVVGTAYSIATFPILVTHFAENNIQAFRDVIENALKRLLFFILPIIAFVFILREPLVTMILKTGAFSVEATVVTSAIVAVLMPHALTTSFLVICARALYARGRSTIPFLIFFILSAAKIALSHITVQFLQENKNFLTMIQSISGLKSAEHNTLFATILIIVLLEVVAVIMIVAVLMRDMQQSFTSLSKVFLQNIIAVNALMISIAFTKRIFFTAIEFSSLKGVFAIGCMSVVGAVVWYAVLRLLKNKESDILKKKAVKVLSRVWKT